MQKAVVKKLFITLILLVAIAAGGVGVYYLQQPTADNFAFGEDLGGYLGDAGEYLIEDDFRKVGFSIEGHRSLSIYNDGIFTGEYGNYLNGVVSAKSANNGALDLCNGQIIYKIPLSFTGVFVNLKSLDVQLEFKIKNGLYEKSLGLSYSYNGTDYTEFVKDVSGEQSDDINTKNIDFSSVLNEKIYPQIINYEFLYVRIDLKHQAVNNVSLSEAELNLYSVKLIGFYKFAASYGASVRATTNKKYGDYSVRYFVSKDLVEELAAKYPQKDYSIYYFNLLMPEDYLELYGDLTIDNLIFGENTFINSVAEESKIVCARCVFTADKRTKKPIEYTNEKGVVYYSYRSAMGNVKTKNLDREFVSKGMISITKKSDGSCIRVLSEYKNGNVKNNSRSVAYIAQSAVKDNSSLSTILNENFLNRLSDREEGCIGGYNINKIYIDKDLNIVNSESVFINSGVAIGDNIVLTTEEKASSMLGYNLIDDPVYYCGKIVYQNKLSDICYASDRTVLTLYYKAL